VAGDRVTATDDHSADPDTLPGARARRLLRTRVGARPPRLPEPTAALPASPAPVGAVESADPRAGWLRRHRTDLAVVAGYLLAALYLMGHLLVDPGRRVLASNPSDQSFFEFVLAHGARLVTHGGNPFFTRQVNMPDGVNLMANTSILGLSLPLAPVTLLFGAATSYAVLSVLALAATATSWYVMLARHVVRHRGAAAVGGWFCAFAPGLAAQSNGHPNIVAQFLVPWIVWRALRLREPTHRFRNAVVLAALVVWQFFINEEVLFLTGVAAGIVIGAYALRNRGEARRLAGPMLRGLALSAGMSLVVLAYPLWFQFFGPQSYRGLPPLIRMFRIDLWSFPSYASESLAGNSGTAYQFAPNPAEQNTFLGWGLLILTALILWRMRRDWLAIGLGLAAVTFAVLSLGSRILIRGHTTGIPGPWALVSRLPLFDTVVAPRLALAVVPLVGVLLALGVEEFWSWSGRPAQRPLAGGPRLAGAALLAIALVPIGPTPLPAVGRAPTPAFFTDGTFRRYVAPGRSVVSVPPPRPPFNALMFDAARVRLDFAFPRGYFLGPGGDPEHPHGLGAIYGAPFRPTSTLMEQVAFSGRLPPIGARERRDARDDLTYWRAAVLVLPFDTTHEFELYQLVNDLVGARPVPVGGVWMWDVRGLVPPPG
jgi:hypothetical protein